MRNTEESIDAASLQMIKGYMLAQEKKILWSKTKASVDKMSMAVRVLKAGSKLCSTKPPSYVIELATLILDQKMGDERDKKKDTGC